VNRYFYKYDVVMSTYKVQPIYGELIYGWLDAAGGDDTPFHIEEVLTSVAWRFKGGKLGAYDMQHPTESSEDYYPNVDSSELAAQAARNDGPDLGALRRILAIRRADKPARRRSYADWTYSFLSLRHLLSEEVDTRRAVTGLHAVYRVVRHLWELAADSREDYQWGRLSTYVRESVAASSAASHLHVPTCLDLARSAQAACATTRVPGLTALRIRFDQLMRASNSADARSRARRVGKELMYGTAWHETLLDNFPQTSQVGGLRCWILHGCIFVRLGTDLAALSRSDLVRVHQMMTGIASGEYATVAQAVVAPGSERLQAHLIAQSYEAQVTRLLDAAVECPYGDEVYVCKAFKRAFTAYLGELSGPCSREETRELWEETLTTPYVRPSALNDWVSECRKWSAGTAHNIGKVYKVCPAPDASPALTLIERHKMVTNRNTCTADALEHLTTVLRDQILRAYIRTPGVRLVLRDEAVRPEWFGAYRAQEFDEVPTSQIHQFLEWEGTALMPQRAADDPAVWKDSGLGWDTWDVATDPSRPPRHGNMLTRMIFDTTAPMPGIRHGGQEHSHKIDTKPEGHKDPARGIYSGNLRDRLNQSWMEVAVERVAVNHPSFMIGTDAATRDSRVRAIVDRCDDRMMQDVYYSFDISGWSPRMDPSVQRASHAIWATLYNEELFRNASTINEGARLYMHKAGYSGYFFNPGANLEGFNGKEMTMILVALLARAVEKWREDIVRLRLATRPEASKWAAILLAYIDDGLAKLRLPRDRCDVLFSQFQQTTVRSFNECGFTIEVSKCFPSDRFAIFLNEPYLGGRHVVHGTRAAMTICAENVEPHTTLLERTTAVSTGCRGAVMAGLDAITGCLLQAYHTWQHVCEWVRRPDPVVAAVWSFLPRAWGGLGLPSALQMGTSGGGAATEEGIQTMQAWAKVSEVARRVFLRCCREQMKDRTAMGVMLSPLGGRLISGPMIESRIPDAVRDALSRLSTEGRLSNLARSFLQYATPASLEDFAQKVLTFSPGAAVQEQLVRDLASAHPHALFSAFAQRIEKSSTLMTIVGTATVRRIIRENRTDAQFSYVTVKSRCM